MFAFIGVQVLCQLALLLPAVGPLRPAVRTSAFAASLVLLLFIPGKGFWHPAGRAVLVVAAILVLSLFHPTTNSLASGVAQAALYIAILAPILWMPRISLSPRNLRTVILLLWGFHTLSSGVGVLQVYFPGRLQPNVTSVMTQKGDAYLDSIRIKLANGKYIFRPMGLTDIPGGASVAGMYCCLLGLGLWLREREPLWLRGICLLSTTLGVFCLYLSQVRSVLIMAGVAVATLSLVVARRGAMRQAAKIMIMLTVIAGGTLVWAVRVGGDAVTGRLATLISDRPDVIYARNRGFSLYQTLFKLLPEYPLGAGLGRWGMMNYYFGDTKDPERGVIWSEIQWSAWVIDGGLPLIVSYLVAVCVACVVTYRVAMGRAPDHGGLDAGWERGSEGPYGLALWAALVSGYNAGAIALTFNCNLFASQNGMEFWLLNGCVFAAAIHARHAAKHGRSGEA